MARTMFRDVGGGQRRAYAGIVTSAFCLLLISMMIAGCSLDSPSSPNTPGQLTGQTTNQQFTFSGTIGVTSFTATLAADDTSTVTISAEVRDNGGNPIQNLTNVTFHTDLGGFLTLDSAGNVVAVDTLTASTFNGVAQAELASVNRATGTANVTVSLGDVTGSAKVVLEPAAVAGTISLAFGASGTGNSTQTGFASQNAPLDVTVGVTALDFEGDPIAGGKVRFRIISDTTDEGSPNEPANWLASSSTFTGANGAAVNVLRVYGAGVIVMEADLIDPVTGAIVSTSNRIILTTNAALIVKLTFSDGTTNFLGNAPYSVGLNAAVFDATNSPRPGLQLIFSTTGDAATLGSTIATTDSQGRTTNSVTVLDSGGGESVTIKAELKNANNQTIASATVTANGS